MKRFIIIAFLFCPILCFGQLPELTNELLKASGATKLELTDSPSQAASLAKENIAKGLIFLLMQGGEAPIVNAADAKFKNEYKVYLYDFGCLAPAKGIGEAYNQVMFEYLTSTYGKSWLRR